MGIAGRCGLENRNAETPFHLKLIDLHVNAIHSSTILSVPFPRNGEKQVLN